MDDNNRDEYSVLRVNDLMERLGIGRDRAYSLMKSPGFPSMKLGKTYLITLKKYEE